MQGVFLNNCSWSGLPWQLPSQRFHKTHLLSKQLNQLSKFIGSLLCCCLLRSSMIAQLLARSGGVCIHINSWSQVDVDNAPQCGSTIEYGAKCSRINAIFARWRQRADSPHAAFATIPPTITSKTVETLRTHNYTHMCVLPPLRGQCFVFSFVPVL